MTASIPPINYLLHHLAPDIAVVSDLELLRRFTEVRDEAAFELLLWRHGSLVWGVCRRVARDRGEAEDAFQATALALAQHAKSIRHGSVAGWLYRVAHRAALRTRSRSAEHVTAVPERPGREPDPVDDVAARELAGAFDVEVSRLSEPYRLAFILCDLEGRTNAEAAAALGCPVGTLESRLTRARQRLRDQLARRGMAVPTTGLAIVSVPTGVHAAAIRAAMGPTAAPTALRDLAAHAAGGARSSYVMVSGIALVAGAALAIGLLAANTSSHEPNPGEPTELIAQVKAKPTNTAAPRRLGSERFRHSGPVFSSAFAPDGKSLATAALGSVAIWEIATGKRLRLIENENVPFHRVAFSNDGKLLFVVVGPLQGGCDLVTFDPATGREVARLPIRNVVYRSSDFAPDGSRFAVYSLQEIEMVLVDTKAGKELTRVAANYEGNTFSADGKCVVMAGGYKSVRTIDSTTGKQLSEVELDRPPEWVRFLAPKDAIFAGRNWVERWDLKKKAAVWKDDFYPSGIGLEVSPDGKRAVHVSRYGISLIDVEIGKELSRPGTRTEGISAKFSPDSKVLAITTAAGTVALLNTDTGEALPQSSDLLGPVSAPTFSADGRSLSVVSGNRWARWDLTAKEARAVSLAGFTSLSPDGRIGIRPDSFNGSEGAVEFLDPVSGKLIANMDPPETGNTVIISRVDRGGQFSGDGNRYVGVRRSVRGAGGQQTELGLAVWETATGKRVAERPADKNVLMPAAVSSDGKSVALYKACDGKFELVIWEPDNDKIRWSRELGSGLLFVAFADHGKRLVFQEYHTTREAIAPKAPIPVGPYPFYVHDAATGKELAKIVGPDLGEQPLVFMGDWPTPVLSARAVSPDGRVLAISNYSGTVHLWDLSEDKELGTFAHPGPVNSLSFSPNGQSLAAASRAGPVMVFDVSATRIGNKR